MSGYVQGETSDLFDPTTGAWVGVLDRRGQEQLVVGGDVNAANVLAAMQAMDGSQETAARDAIAAVDSTGARTAAVLTGALGSSATQAPTHSAVAAAIAALGGSGQVKAYKSTGAPTTVAASQVFGVSARITIPGLALGANGLLIWWVDWEKVSGTADTPSGQVSVMSGTAGSPGSGTTVASGLPMATTAVGAQSFGFVYGNRTDQSTLIATHPLNVADPTGASVPSSGRNTRTVDTSADWQVIFSASTGSTDTVRVKGCMAIVFNPDASAGGGASTLAALTDVDLTGITAGQSFVWNGTDMVPWGAVVADASTRAALIADVQRPYLNWASAVTITLNYLTGARIGDVIVCRHGGSNPDILAGTNVTINGTMAADALRERATLQLVADTGSAQTWEWTA